MEGAPKSASKRRSYAIDQSPLYRLGSHRKLANLLGISVLDLRRFRHSEAMYREFDLAKKGGGSRRIENPARNLKRVQAKLARLLTRIEPPNYLYCPVKGRSYISNAAQHLNNRVVRCLDIKKYFPSTPSHRVYWFFRSILKCETDVADTLTRLSTYRKRLPTGSPLSPFLAYFAYCSIWERVASIARDHGVTLTVYVDDVTLSGKRVPRKIVWEIEKVIHSSGLRYHKEKSYFDRPAEITGVIVNRERLLAPQRQHKKLHLVKVSLARTCGKEKTAALTKIGGLQGQMKQISNGLIEALEPRR
ncbi:reverse transcriptase family protein [Bradyrhizobium sp. DOA1]|uniref:reverse transcriptase family protein n=1 Tax=Bradyrhizobium sp. DOA1 TaxID=1126616 RepID=UPI0009EE1DEC